MRPITCPLPRIRPPRICYASHLWLCDAGLPGRPPGRSSGPACCRSSPQQCCPRCSEDSRSRTWPWLLSFTSRTWRNRRCERYQKQRTRDFFADRLPSFDRLRRPHENLLPNCSSAARGSASVHRRICQSDSAGDSEFCTPRWHFGFVARHGASLVRGQTRRRRARTPKLCAARVKQSRLAWDLP